MNGGSGKPEETKELVYDFDGRKETETAVYFEGEGFFLYVPARLEAATTEAGETVLTTVEIPHGTLAVKELPADADMAGVRKAIAERLEKEYPKDEAEVVGADSSHWLEGANFLLQTQDDSTFTTAGVLESEGKRYEVSMKLWQSETWTYPVFRAVLETLKPITATGDSPVSSEAK